jgi:hypothetical protein
MCKNYQVKFIDLMKGGNQLILRIFNELCGGRCGNIEKNKFSLGSIAGPFKQYSQVHIISIC